MEDAGEDRLAPAPGEETVDVARVDGADGPAELKPVAVVTYVLDGPEMVYVVTPDGLPLGEDPVPADLEVVPTVVVISEPDGPAIV